MALQVREAEPTELRAAFALWIRAESARTRVEPSEAETREFVESMTQASAKPGARLLVGLDEGALVAAIYGVPLRSDPAEAQVAMLCVEPKFWRRGIGAEMLKALTSCLREQGCRQLRMNVDPTNDPARALYERQGWRHQGETEQVDGSGVAELIYRVDLGSADAQ